ncbi:unnamed protein product [Ilex paraguariensis]|uniref:Acyl carrier protein n=1 Tax=Ilex paraguariensis TaxID=185542 RepID=A0ABC8SL88_9AQUA
MQSLRNSILRYVSVRVSMKDWFLAKNGNPLNGAYQQLPICSMSNGTNYDQIMDRVIGMVKRSNSIDATKVTETADFQKDLSLDSLDRVELVMAFEQEFSIEIPDEKADRLKCCADVTKYIISEADQKIAEKS